MISVFILIIAATVSAYGPPANVPAVHYRPVNNYHVPLYHHNRFYSSGSYEKACPDLRTYLPTYASVPNEAFYPPTIRYLRKHGRLYARITCSRKINTINALFSRINSSREIVHSNFVSVGNAAAVIVKCDRDDERYYGDVIDVESSTHLRKAEFTEVACLGADKTIAGRKAEWGVEAIKAAFQNPASSTNNRKKRAAEQPTTTSAHTTAGPTTAGPTTAGPTTAGPTTAGPTTAGPTTTGPTTAGPTTAGPTTTGSGSGSTEATTKNNGETTTQGSVESTTTSSNSTSSIDIVLSGINVENGTISEEASAEIAKSPESVGAIATAVIAQVLDSIF